MSPPDEIFTLPLLLGWLIGVATGGMLTFWITVRRTLRSLERIDDAMCSAGTSDVVRRHQEETRQALAHAETVVREWRQRLAATERENDRLRVSLEAVHAAHARCAQATASTPKAPAPDGPPPPKPARARSPLLEF